MGINLQKFTHYTFFGGENKGEPSTSKKSYELDRTLNVELRGQGVSTRFGSQILTVDSVTGFPDPITGNNLTVSIQGHSSSTGGNEVLFVNNTSIYKNPVTPAVLLAGVTASKAWQWAAAGDVLYCTNSTDGVFYYDPVRSLTTMYAAGYSTPATFTATPVASGGSMADGDYSYYVTLYDINTNTQSNRQTAAVTATVVGGGGSGSVALTLLPVVTADNASHWIIYRKDPGGYYFYRHARVAYDSVGRAWTDTIASTGTKEIVANDNYAPDDSTGMFVHGSRMIYYVDNRFMWSKVGSFQNVPTVNEEILSDNSQDIVKGVSYYNTAVFFKTDSIYTLTGSLTSGEYTISCISSKVGCSSPDSVVVSTYGIFFLDSVGKVRLLTLTDFSSSDLRETTDISHFFREKMALVSPTHYSNCHAVFYESREVKQYRLFVPIDSASGKCDHCYVYDYTLSSKYPDVSSWFDFKIGTNAICSTTGKTSSEGIVIYSGDDFGLVWQFDKRNTYYDGSTWDRDEETGSLSYPSNVTMTVSPSPLWDVNEFTGVKVTFYDEYTFSPFHESKIVSNTADTITFQDILTGAPTENPFVSIGGYLVYFGTANFSRNLVGRNKPFKIEAIFATDKYADEIRLFMNYDFMLPFNYTYSYFNNPLLGSLSPTCDTYDIAIGKTSGVYDDVDSVYDGCAYNYSEYSFVSILLRNMFLFKTTSWGVVTRKSGQSFSYLGATMYYQPKGDLL